MSLSAAVLDALVQAGATREQLVAAMRADIAEREAATAAKLDNKRKGNRERQQRKRNNDRNAESRVTVVTERDARDKGSNDRDILTSPENKKPKPKGLVKKRMPIPDDWQPVEFAIGSESRKVVDGWPPGEMAAQLEQLKAYHRSKHNTFLDPQDAWSTWVLNTRKWGIGRHERSDRDQTTVALERLLGGNVGAHAGTGQIAQAGRPDHDER